ncbi:hypothetical protein B0F90DRAFT_1920675 [Multifurca ochricompacta]|uniref:Uncharacterized protein n=1 Tax=Multifurca ochricompacta TaxID=376703 RepID=A0AAD4LUK1_9AGAM|nr:hypothetical protein B0F90DRAFT_1920675 [Multifurca ochricompacta]
MEVGQVPEPSQVGIGDPVNGRSRGAVEEDVSGGGELGELWALPPIATRLSRQKGQRGVCAQCHVGRLRTNGKGRVPPERTRGSATWWGYRGRWPLTQSSTTKTELLDMKLWMLSRGINVSTVLKGSVLQTIPAICRIRGIHAHFPVYDFKELMAVIVPPQFTRLKRYWACMGI